MQTLTCPPSSFPQFVSSPDLKQTTCCSLPSSPPPSPGDHAHQNFSSKLPLPHSSSYCSRQIRWVSKILHSKHPSLNSPLYSSLQLQEIFFWKAKASPGREVDSLTGDLHVSLFDFKYNPHSPHSVTDSAIASPSSLLISRG